MSLAKNILVALYDTGVGHTNTELALLFLGRDDVHALSAIRVNMMRLRQQGVNVIKQLDPVDKICRYYIVRGVADRKVQPLIGRPPHDLAFS